MALPKINHPVYQEIIPSTKETVWIRPYLVKEQKILQTLGESKNATEIFQNMKNLVVSCIEKGNYDPDKLTVYDVLWLMLKLRAVSVGEDVEQIYVCKTEKNGEPCGETIRIKYKISDVKYKEPDSQKYPDNVVMINDDLGVRLFYPRINFMPESDTTENIIRFVAQNIDYIFTNKEKFTNFTEEEAVDFLRNLTIEEFGKILEFYTEENLPKVYITLKYKCPKCGNEDTIELNTIMDFF